MNFDGVKYLLKYNANLDNSDCIGRTALHFIVQADIDGKFTEWLLSEECYKGTYNLNAMTKSGVSPLMLAVKLNHPKVIEQLLNAGANPFLKDQLGQEAMDYKITQIHEDKDTDPIDQMLETAKR